MNVAIYALKPEMSNIAKYSFFLFITSTPSIYDIVLFDINLLHFYYHKLVHDIMNDSD